MKFLMALISMSILSACGPNFNSYTHNDPPAPTATPVPVAADYVSVDSPTLSNDPKSGTITISGRTGSTWVNIAVFDADNGYSKVSNDFTPVNSFYTLSLDTTQFPNGTRHLNVTGYSVPAGGSGGTYYSVFFNLVISN